MIMDGFIGLISNKPVSIQADEVEVEGEAEDSNSKSDGSRSRGTWGRSG